MKKYIFILIIMINLCVLTACDDDWITCTRNSYDISIPCEGDVLRG